MDSVQTNHIKEANIMRKIVFFDIDGTLLDFDKALPISTKNAINQLKKNGVYVAIATGRAPFMFKELREQLDIDSYVCFNGQYVVFENEVIYKNPLNKESLHKLYEKTKESQIPLVFMNDQCLRGTVSDSDHVRTTLATFGLEYPELSEKFYIENDVYQTLLYCTEQEEATFEQEDGEVRFIRWHPVCTDVVPANGSKAAGIKKFIERAGFELENVYAFGDGLNDIEMLQTVGTGIAMGNAEEELLKHADYVTTAVNEDGIYNGLVHVGLLK